MHNLRAGIIPLTRESFRMDSQEFRNIDLNDTGLWRLAIMLKASGIKAWLLPRDGNSLPGRKLLDASWPEVDCGRDLLSKIENCVYDNPRILDDYSADIIIDAPRTLFIPSEMADSDSAEDFFTKIYPSEPEDIMTEETRSATALFHLAPGLKAFLSRTFPGARIGCSLAQYVRRLEAAKSAVPRLTLGIDSNRVALTLFAGAGFLSSSSQTWKTADDIIFHIFNLLDAYAISPEETVLTYCGDTDVITPKIPLLDKYLHSAQPSEIQMPPGADDLPPELAFRIHTAPRN